MGSTQRVVILGGGFAGVKCARTLRKRLPKSVEVVLFNKENHMVFHPMLAEVAGGSINPEAVAAPLRQMLPRVLNRTEEVERVDVEARQVHFLGFDGRARVLDYEHLVLGCGSVVNLGMVPGMADHAFPMKTVGDAVQLRAHVMQRLEQAEVCDDPEHRRWLANAAVLLLGRQRDVARAVGLGPHDAHLAQGDRQLLDLALGALLLPRDQVEEWHAGAHVALELLPERRELDLLRLAGHGKASKCVLRTFVGPRGPWLGELGIGPPCPVSLKSPALGRRVFWLDESGLQASITGAPSRPDPPRRCIREWTGGMSTGCSC